MRHEHTLPSGRTLGMNVAPFGVVSVLRFALFAELKAAKLDVSDGIVRALILSIGPAAAVGLEGEAAEKAKIEAKRRFLQALAGEDVETVKNLVSGFLSSPSFENAVFACMERCVIDEVKVDRKSFEDEDARGDFYPAAWEVLKINIRPFFASLPFGSSSPTGKSSAAPK